jgi:F420-dependent oxidoreductase-like protein
MRLAIGVSPAAGWTYDEIRDLARDTEAAGISTFWVTDHFFAGSGEPSRNCLEAWVLLAGLARDTTTLRLGTLVTAQSYRNPAYLAKVVASVDHLSGGRVEFGLGAGWKENEYAAYGYEFPAPGVRVSQLRDTLEIVIRMWTEDRATYEGRHYAVRGAVCAPKPAQRPAPPIWIGGTKPRVMRLAARYADGFNIDQAAKPEVPGEGGVRAVLERIEEACGAVARSRPLMVSQWAPAEIPDDRASAGIAARARQLAELGLAQLQLMVPRTDARRTLERIVREVQPAI